MSPAALEPVCGNRTEPDRSSAGARGGLELRWGCCLQHAGSHLCSELSPSGWHFHTTVHPPHLLAQPGPYSSVGAQGMEADVTTSLLFWLRGPGSQPLFPFCPPTTCLASHTTLFCLWNLPLVSQVEAPPTLKSQVPPFSSIFRLRARLCLTFTLGLGVLYGEEPGRVGVSPCLGDRQQQ